MTDRWLVVGGSPCVRRFVHVIAEWSGKVATVNKGLALVPKPDVYFIADPSALRERKSQARELLASGGRVVTIDGRLPGASVNIPAEGGPFEPFTRGRFSNAPLSGAFLVQWFANMTPPPLEVHLLGFEGYRSQDAQGVVDHWDGSKRNARAGGHTEPYGVFMRSVFEQTPDIRWTVYGDPTWPCGEHANVERVV